MLGEDESPLAETVLMLTRSISAPPRSVPGSPHTEQYVKLVCGTCGSLTGIGLMTAIDLIEATQDYRRRSCRSGVLKRNRDQAVEDLQRPAAAVVGSAGGLRCRSMSAPAGGSSIMPGKVKPGGNFIGSCAVHSLMA